MVRSKLVFLISLIFLGVFSRWVPHPMNFTAVGAVALLAGSVLRMRVMSLILPVVILFLSDLVLGFHSTMIYVYGAFLITILMGYLIPEKNYLQRSQVFKIFGLAFSSSFVFFVITNFGVWQSLELYSKDFSGLIECYVMGLPFLKNQILGDLFFSGILFSAYEVLGKRLGLQSSELLS